MEEVWKLIYDSFKSSSFNGFMTATATGSTRNEVQLRLQNAVSEYKTTPSEHLLNTICADVRVANAMGYISDETTGKILDKLER